MADPIKKSNHLFTYAEYCSWPDDERWELIEGIAYNMSPAPNQPHQKTSSILHTKIGHYLEDKECELYAAPFDVVFMEKYQSRDDAASVVQPDLSVICDLTKITHEGCTGAPDLVVEILSPGTSKKDYHEKFMLYEKNGVQEYWIVDPELQYIRIFHLQKDGKYGEGVLYEKNGVIESVVLKEFSLDLSDLFMK